MPNRLTLTFTPPNARVEISPPIPADRAVTLTGTTGLWMTEALPPGNYTLRVSAEGYQPWSRSLTLDNSDTPVALEAYLLPLPPVTPSPAPQPAPAPASSATLEITRPSGSPYYLKLLPNRGTWNTSGNITTIRDLPPGTYTLEVAPEVIYSLNLAAGETRKLLLGSTSTQAPAPSPTPQPSPAPSPAGAKLLWDIRSAGDRDHWTDSLTANDIAALNNTPFDGVSLMVSGFTLECCRPGFTLNELTFTAQLRKAAGVKRRKRVVIRTAHPAPPTDTAAWNRMIQQHAAAARILQSEGWDGFDHDPEPYQNPDGSPIRQTNYWDYGWWMLFRNYPSELRALWRAYAQALAQAFPGIGYGWYHGAAAGDGAAPGWVNAGQAGNGFLGLGHALVGMNQAVSLDGAPIFVEQMNEDFEGNDLDWGAGWAQKAIDYARLQTPLAQGLSEWTSMQSFGHMRRKGSARTDPAGIRQTLPALWASLSPAVGYYARISVYHEYGDPLTPEIVTALGETKPR